MSVVTETQPAYSRAVVPVFLRLRQFAAACG